MATKKQEAQAKEQPQNRKLPWWGKILAGSIVGFLLVKYTPILDCLTMFFYVVMVPVMMLASVGLISSGTLEAMSQSWKDTVEQINSRVHEKVKAAA